MDVDPVLLETLEAALLADPSKTTVRLHLAGLLLQSGRSGEALNHARVALAERPADIAALELAAGAAAAAGEATQAEGYRRLLSALAGDRPPPAVEGAEEGTAAQEAAVDSQPDPEEPAQEEPEEDEDDEPGGVLPFRLIRGEGGAAERPAMTLADVAGLDEVKRRLELAFLGPIRHPELAEKYGKAKRGGLLLYGPPGCGKTFLARAVAGELGAGFLSVRISDVLDAWFGQSERNLHELFEMARQQRPCVLFFDELDALGRKRSLVRYTGGGMSTLINQFLSELDGVDSDNDGLFALAATNHPWDVDTALRRPGRFDRTVLVLPPDAPGRRGILEFHLRERPVERLKLDWIVGRTGGFSGADLGLLCDAAAELAIEDAVRGEARPINQRDFKRALKKLRPSTRPWFEMARNYALFDAEGGAYDDLIAYLRKIKMA